MKIGMNIRRIASNLLPVIVKKRVSLGHILDPECGDSSFLALPYIDQKLVHAILNTTLRFLPRIDAVLDSVLVSSLSNKNDSLRQLLRISIAQILYLDVADYAVVDLSVEQVKNDKKNRHFSKLVNAILRRVCREKSELLQCFSEVPTVPEWFRGRLEKYYGKDSARAIAAACLYPGYIDLTVKSDIEIWARKLNAVVLPTGGIRLRNFKGNIFDLPGFEEGNWWVQDASASVPVQLFGRLDGLSVLDLCAAPGGKTAQLIVSGAKVVALDVSGRRLKKLRDNLKRLCLFAEVIEIDAFNYRPEKLFDAVLVDAPCSSTGTMRRHPDVLWTKNLKDIADSARFQERLLSHGLTFLKPGGMLVFSNCSLDKQDSEEVVEKVLKNPPFPIEVLPLKAESWKKIEGAITPEGWFRATPNMLGELDGVFPGIDGFFAVVLRRIM
ncbi:RsmB/NOP family class I SAM-dependent RNA methyltransferase [Candidatus Liberibacter sp.]|uniref:RsmB/NOP family class I SAM-dependent RNA methyltransferase n=1 Tax=Candidatus Liberibacter sp. TaxID=34022 RepID=UPI0015F6389F|nr:RsmB/NOP family class I SAM-dependent RNA methyltransferase [Candidatus Liberibacter sp.]MBA5723638.1 RsmB/NOP family class I SAM-dependent RNA methyltransferase [Candidatus Liberibacter sp.]